MAFRVLVFMRLANGIVGRRGGLVLVAPRTAREMLQGHGRVVVNALVQGGLTLVELGNLIIDLTQKAHQFSLVIVPRRVIIFAVVAVVIATETA